MSYTVRVSPSAVRELTDRLPDAVGWACLRFVYGQLAVEPREVGTPLLAPFDGLWHATRGEYRVHYRLDDEAATIDVLDMTHRNGLVTRALLG